MHFGRACVRGQKGRIYMEHFDEEIEKIIEEPVQTGGLNWKKEVLEWIGAIVVALILAFFIRTFIFTLVQVEGPSMEDTMHTGDRVFVLRLLYEPKAGDIVVFTPDQHPDTPYIKRVIATEGQTVDIDFVNGIVFVDGEALDEPYTKTLTNRNGDTQFPLTVPEDCIFVMGDNRAHSHDGRSSDVTSDESPVIGCVSKKDVMGRALFRLWPLNQFGKLQ